MEMQPPVRFNRHAFSLVELLVVIGIIVILAAVSMMALRGPSESFSLRAAAEQIKGELSLARQQALTMNSAVEVRFFRENSGAPYRAMQAYLDDGSGNPTAFSKVYMLPDKLEIPAETELAPMLVLASSGTQPAGNSAVSGWEYAVVTFRSSGELADVSREDAFLTVVDGKLPRAAGTVPDNYARLAITPLTGAMQVIQPE